LGCVVDLSLVMHDFEMIVSGHLRGLHP